MTGRDRSDELFDGLRRIAAEVDPVPNEVTAYARTALGWRRIDAELAELGADSALDRKWAELARSGVAGPRSVTFGREEEGLEIKVSIERGDDGLVLRGQLAPPASATIEVQRDDASVAGPVDANELGRFLIELDAGGRLRLRIHRQRTGPVETSWIDI